MASVMFTITTTYSQLWVNLLLLLSCYFQNPYFEQHILKSQHLRTIDKLNLVNLLISSSPVVLFEKIREKCDSQVGKFNWSIWHNHCMTIKHSIVEKWMCYNGRKSLVFFFFFYKSCFVSMLIKTYLSKEFDALR